MKNSAQKGNTFLIILVCAAIIIGAVIYYSNSFQENAALNTANTPPPTPATTKFQSSSVMKFSALIPQGFDKEEKFTLVTFKNNQGAILVSKSGTNFNSLNDHVEFIKEKNGFELSSEKLMSLNGYSTIVGLIGEEKNYFIMPDDSYAVYTVSTKSPQLYSALDQIAKSFRYTP